MDISILNNQQLLELGCRVNGGTFGKDPARMNKGAKLAYLRQLADDDTLAREAAEILSRNGIADSPATLPHVVKIAHEQTDSFDPRDVLVTALRACIGPVAGGMDEGRVRAIVREEISALLRRLG